MLSKVYKLFSVLLCAGAIFAADDAAVPTTGAVKKTAMTARFVTADDLADSALMNAARLIISDAPGFEHLVDVGKWGVHLTNIQLPRVEPDAIRMMLFFMDDVLKAVGAGGMMPLAISPVYLNVPTTVVSADGTVSVAEPVKLKFVEDQEAIAAQYKSLVVSQGVTPVEQYNVGTPGSWSITNTFASTVTIATALGYQDSSFVAMHATFFEACRGKKLSNGQTPILHICTLANGEGADTDFSVSNLKKYPGSFNYYTGDKARGKRAMLVGAYSDKPLS